MSQEKADELAAHWADQFAILNDFKQSNNAARIYLSERFGGSGDNTTIRTALYESAFISFRRAIKNGQSRIPGDGRATWKIPKEDWSNIVKEQEEYCKNIKDVADKCVAHRASHKAGAADVVIMQPSGEYHLNICYSEHPRLIEKLLTITERAEDYLEKEIERTRTKITECRAVAAPYKMLH